MESQFVIALLIAGLNTPVYLELYKHSLKNKAVWTRVAITLIYWAVALMTQTLAAFVSILYLYFSHYRHLESHVEFEDQDKWHIGRHDIMTAVLFGLLAKIVITVLNAVFIIILTKLADSNVKPQDIVTYYTEAQSALKMLLAVEIVLIAPIVEEFVFRYFFYDKILSPRMPLALAAVISAALFTTAHFNLSGIPTFFGLGLACTYLYHKKGYWAAVIVHGISNLFTLVAMFFL